jgi:hypothetical protein
MPHGSLLVSTTVQHLAQSCQLLDGASHVPLPWLSMAWPNPASRKQGGETYVRLEPGGIGTCTKASCQDSMAHLYWTLPA